MSYAIVAATFLIDAASGQRVYAELPGARKPTCRSQVEIESRDRITPQKKRYGGARNECGQHSEMIVLLSRENGRDGSRLEW
jgi:hypothetical protein